LHTHQPGPDRCNLNPPVLLLLNERLYIPSGDGFQGGPATIPYQNKKKKNSPETTVQGPWSTVAKSQVVKIGSHLVFPRKIHSGQPLQNLAQRF